MASSNDMAAPQTHGPHHGAKTKPDVKVTAKLAAKSMSKSSAKSIGHHLTLAARLHRARLAQLLEDLGLFPGQEQVLEVLARHESLSVGALAGLLRVRPPTASKTVARLSAAGLVERRPAAQARHEAPEGRADARIVHVALTATGRERAAAMAELTDTLEAELTALLDKGERKRLRKLLRRLEKGLKASLGPEDEPDDEADDEPLLQEAGHGSPQGTSPAAA